MVVLSFIPFMVLDQVKSTLFSGSKKHFTADELKRFAFNDGGSGTDQILKQALETLLREVDQMKGV